MVQIRRILAVTGGLVITGAITGATIGVLILAGGALVVGGLHGWQPFAAYIALAAAAGAAIGAVLAPLAAWVFLRTVPLGRAVLETAIGTLLGAIAMWFIPAIGPINGAILGFGVAAVRLGLVTRRRRVAEQRIGARTG